MARRRSVQPRDSSETKPNGGATSGHEAELWATADALRGSMDAAECKHVVLGLIFLKYILRRLRGTPCRGPGRIRRRCRRGPGRAHCREHPLCAAGNSLDASAGPSETVDHRHDRRSGDGGDRVQ